MSRIRHDRPRRRPGGRRTAVAAVRRCSPPARCCPPAPGRPPRTATPSDDTIALLLPDAKTARYETFDRPLFEARVAELGDYDVLYANADQDAAKQQQQAESALTSGAGVLVLDPVDANAAVSIVEHRQRQGRAGHLVRPSDRRRATSPTTSRSTTRRSACCRRRRSSSAMRGDRRRQRHPDGERLADRQQRGAVQARAPTASSTTAACACSPSTTPPDWSPDKAQEWVSGQIAQYGDAIAGVYAANDAHRRRRDRGAAGRERGSAADRDRSGCRALGASSGS